MILNKVEPLLQADYGGSLDCTLTSITTVIRYYNPELSDKKVYDVVESVAKNYLYESEKLGTFPLMTKGILNSSMKKLGIKKTSKSKYLKGVYTFKDIKKIIDKGAPIIFSVWKADKYKDHTITIIGYEGNDTLVVYDNWDKEKHNISYKEVSKVSSINWVV